MAGLLDFMNSPWTALGTGLLQAAGPHTDPSKATLGAGLGAGLNAMQQQAQLKLRQDLARQKMAESARQQRLQEQELAMQQEQAQNRQRAIGILIDPNSSQEQKMQAWFSVDPKKAASGLMGRVADPGGVGLRSKGIVQDYATQLVEAYKELQSGQPVPEERKILLQALKHKIEQPSREWDDQKGWYTKPGSPIPPHLQALHGRIFGGTPAAAPPPPPPPPGQPLTQPMPPPVPQTRTSGSMSYPEIPIGDVLGRPEAGTSAQMDAARQDSVPVERPAPVTANMSNPSVSSARYAAAQDTIDRGLKPDAVVEFLPTPGGGSEMKIHDRGGTVSDDINAEKWKLTLKKETDVRNNIARRVREQSRRSVRAATVALKQLQNPFSSGPLAQATSWIWSSPGADMEAHLTAMMGVQSFQELRKIRGESVSGGGVGQVSNFENRMMAAVDGALAKGMSREALAGSLENIQREAIAGARWEYRKFASEYGQAEADRVFGKEFLKELNGLTQYKGEEDIQFEDFEVKFPDAGT